MRDESHYYGLTSMRRKVLEFRARKLTHTDQIFSFLVILNRVFRRYSCVQYQNKLDLRSCIVFCRAWLSLKRGEEHSDLSLWYANFWTSSRHLQKLLAAHVPAILAVLQIHAISVCICATKGVECAWWESAAIGLKTLKRTVSPLMGRSQNIWKTKRWFELFHTQRYAPRKVLLLIATNLALLVQH